MERYAAPPGSSVAPCVASASRDTASVVSPAPRSAPFLLERLPAADDARRLLWHAGGGSKEAGRWGRPGGQAQTRGRGDLERDENRQGNGRAARRQNHENL
jgi:hypothetical protein